MSVSATRGNCHHNIPHLGDSLEGQEYQGDIEMREIWATSKV